MNPYILLPPPFFVRATAKRRGIGVCCPPPLPHLQRRMGTPAPATRTGGTVGSWAGFSFNYDASHSLSQTRHTSWLRIRNFHPQYGAWLCRICDRQIRTPMSHPHSFQGTSKLGGAVDRGRR